MSTESDQAPNLVESSEGVRVLCVSDARGTLKRLNELAAQYKADVIVHTGSFGFFDGDSTTNMGIPMLASAATFSKVVRTHNFRELTDDELREAVGSQLSELPLFLAGAETFNVPVYTVWGSSEDVHVIRKFRDGTYSVPNLHIVDETNAPVIPGTSIRLVGLPGQFLPARLFDAGDDAAGTTIAGISGLAWVTMWQIGQLARTVRDTFQRSEVRIFMTHSPLSHNAILSYLALLLRADFTISGSLHSRFTSSFNEYAINPGSSQWERRIEMARSAVHKLWSSVESQVVEDTHSSLQLRALITSTVQLLMAPPRGPAYSYLKQAHRNLWHFNLCDVDVGAVVLSASPDGVIGASSESTGFDFKLRSAKKTHAFTESATVADDGLPNSGDEDGDVKDDHEDGGDEEGSKQKEEASSDHKNGSSAAGAEISAHSDGSSATNSFTNGKDTNNTTTEKQIGAKKAASSTKTKNSTKGKKRADLEANSDSSGRASTPPAKSNSGVGEEPKAAADSQKKKRTTKKELKELRAKIAEQEWRPVYHGLFFKNGRHTANEILEFLHEEDRPAAQVAYRAHTRADGTLTQVVVVYFDTQEQAVQAYDRVDKGAAGTVSILQPNQYQDRYLYQARSTKFGGRMRGPRRWD